MKYQEGTPAVILVLLLAIASFAQTNSATQTVQKQGVVEWTVEIGKSNGQTGEEHSQITVNSLGELVCKNAKLMQSKSLSSESLQQLSHLVDAVRRLKTKTEGLTEEAVLCVDCESVEVTLTRRDTDGKIKVYPAGWNVLTRAHVPEAVLNLYNGIMVLSCKEK